MFQQLSKSKFLSFMTINPRRTQVMKIKQNQIFFNGTYFNLTSQLFLSKNIKLFQWILKSKFLNFMTKVNPNEMKQNQIFFHGIYANLTSFFVGHKILKWINDFYNWHLSILLQKWAQTSKVKLNGICAHVQIWQHFSLFTMWYTI